MEIPNNTCQKAQQMDISNKADNDFPKIRKKPGIRVESIAFILSHDFLKIYL